jgi:alkyl hydroperoxide reductase subunit AhpC
MIVDVGDEVPDFACDSQLGNISFHAAIDGQWAVLVTFRSAFDPVATTDLGMIAKMITEFEARKIAVFTMGCDTGRTAALVRASRAIRSRRIPVAMYMLSLLSLHLYFCM